MLRVYTRYGPSIYLMMPWLKLATVVQHKPFFKLPFMSLGIHVANLAEGSTVSRI